MYVMLVPLVGVLRTCFNHTTITTELRNFPLSVMTSSKILPTKQPGLPFSGPAGRRPSEEDTINSRQLIEQKWETLPRLIIPQRMITFLPPTRLFFLHLEIPFIEKSRSVLLYDSYCTKSYQIMPTTSDFHFCYCCYSLVI